MTAKEKTIRRTLLRVLLETGGRKRTVLLGLAGGNEKLIDDLVREGKVVIRGVKKGSLYEHA